ncbi:hypothetical protein M569_11115, partial [Genlisea aurea]
YGKMVFLSGIGIRRTEMDMIVGLFPGILEFEVESRLKPLVDEFRDLGFCPSGIKNEILRNPWILGLENGEASQWMETLRSVKCRAGIKDEERLELSVVYGVKQRIDFLRKHGLMTMDALKVVWREPRVIINPLQDIENKVKFLIHEMNFDVQCLVEVPEILGLNFEREIVPRFNVIEYLRLNGGLGDDVDLKKFVKLSRLKFYNMYVKPYPQCKKIYGK